MQASLSNFLRNAAENHFEGPIPAIERDRIRVVESAERAFDRSLPPLERSLRSLSLAYADMLRDSALVEASRQVLAELGAGGRGQTAELYRRRTEMLAESAAWLAEKAGNLAELARREGARG
jgi:hypothetical protein